MRLEQMEALATAQANAAHKGRTGLTEDQRQVLWQQSFHFNMFTLLGKEVQRQVNADGGWTDRCANG